MNATLNVTKCFAYDQKIEINGRQNQNHKNDFDHSRKFFLFPLLVGITSVCTLKFIMCDQHLHWTTKQFFLTHKFTACCHCSSDTQCRLCGRDFFSLHLSFFGPLSFVSMLAVVCYTQMCVCCNLTYQNQYSIVVCRVVTGAFNFVCESSIIISVRTICCERDIHCTAKPCTVSFRFVPFFFFLFCFILSNSKL